jgi:hypothetical protein
MSNNSTVSITTATKEELNVLEENLTNIGIIQYVIRMKSQGREISMGTWAFRTQWELQEQHKFLLPICHIISIKVSDKDLEAIIARVRLNASIQMEAIQWT